MIVFVFVFFLLVLKFILDTSQFGTKLHVGVFDINELYGTREPAPRSSPVEFKYLNYNVFDNFNNKRYYIEYKESLENHDTDKEYYKGVIREVMNKFELKDPNDVIIRFASCPHRVLSHFDCVERYIHLVKGMKRVLLFDLEFDHNYILRILHESKDFDFYSMKNKLINESVAFDEYDMRPGDTIHIPAGKFHYVECGRSRENTILLSLDYDKDHEYLDNEFERLWPSSEWKYEKY
jgi:hypothetical protein